MSGRSVLICRSDEVAERGRVVVDVDGREIGVFRVGGKLYAYANRCVHAGGPVCQGKIVPRIQERIDEHRQSQGLEYSDVIQVACPWHGYEYDLRTGEHPVGNGVRLRRYSVSESADGITVEI